MRVVVDRSPFPDVTDGQWPAAWVCLPDAPRESFVAAYRLEVSIDADATVRIHVSADQRYELFVDGSRVGRGPERGDEWNWFFESYDLELPRGLHVVVARVWSLDLEALHAPAAQISVRHGFLLAADGVWSERMNTGRAPWHAKRVDGFAFSRSPLGGAGTFAGGVLRVDAALYPWGVERGEGEGWFEAVPFEIASERVGNARYGELGLHRLRPARLPAMLELERRGGRVRHADRVSAEVDEVVNAVHSDASAVRELQALLDGGRPLTIAANTRVRFIVDLDDYCCAYPELQCSGGGGARLRLQWAESLFLPGGEGHDPPKGDRNAIDGKVFRGRGDEFVADGGAHRRFSTLWWSAGRYLELRIETQSEPLRIERFGLTETRYPLELRAEMALSDPRFERVAPILWRTLEVCSHETFMDCPYYEQLQYAGDTRLEALVTLACAGDERLPRKALELYGASLLGEGLTQARYPANRRQIIPQFSLFWVAMLHDYALWRGDAPLLRSLLPRARTVLETFLAHIDEAGLLRTPDGWDWVDWVPSWPRGTPPLDSRGRSGINLLQLVMVLGLAVELEGWVGVPALRTRWDDARRTLLHTANAALWSEERGLYADTVEHHGYSEHAQCYAVLGGLPDARRRARIAASLDSAALTRGTFYFQHYLFETCRVLGRTDVVEARLEGFYEFLDLGLKTALEKPDPSRSDCHAWASHPLLHVLIGFVGIRPDAFGFTRVRIEPALGNQRFARGALVHPLGLVRAEISRASSGVTGWVELPNGLPGCLVIDGRERPLEPGLTRF